MASLLKRGSKFYIRVYVNGKAKDIATKTTNIKIAEKLLQKVEYENATGQLATATRTPLAKLLEDFVAHLRANHRQKSVKNDLSRLRMIFGPLTPALELAAKKDNLTGEVQGKPREPDATEPPRVVAEYAEQINPPLINRYLDHRAAVVGPKTLNADREILYQLFRYAIEHHGLVYPDPRIKNPVDGVRPRKLLTHEIRFLNPKQIVKQLQAIVERHPSGASRNHFVGIDECADRLGGDVRMNSVDLAQRFGDTGTIPAQRQSSASPCRR
ncbi:MAG: hypothetical protein M3O30_10795 [Planctomycetota bacterium]|nr:hypothetical protein [Planctomycetota bacterium]